MGQSTLMLTISGIRGLVGDSLTPDVVSKYVRSFFEMLFSVSAKPVVVLGSDTRPSVPEIKQVVLQVLLERGAHVIDIGVVPTPTVQLYVEHRRADGGIMITASHNPNPWCGLKFIDRTGIFFGHDQCRTLYNPGDPVAPITNDGVHEVDDKAIEFHVETVLSQPIVDRKAVEALKLRVAIDVINGAGHRAVPLLVSRLGCEVVLLNGEANGKFAHTPEPLPENLGGLCETVLAKGCALGIAVDPDADRCVLVNEKGEPIGEEYTLGIAVDLALRAGCKAPVVKNLGTTRAINEICSSFGVECVECPIGEVNVALKMRELNSDIGGEGNGGVLLKTCHLGRDSLVSSALALTSIALHRKTASELKASLPQWFITKTTIRLTPGCDIDAVLRRWEAELCIEGVVMNREDGLKASHHDWWVSVRRSNTEPIIRVMGEGRTREDAARIVGQVQERINEIIGELQREAR